MEVRSSNERFKPPPNSNLGKFSTEEVGETNRKFHLKAMQCGKACLTTHARPSASDGHTLSKFYGQAERPISTGKLHALLRFHPPPIKVVVFDWPSYPPAGGLGNLILRRASRLDAFSDYLFQISLPSDATGVTARSQEICSSRSSRTRDNSSQVSCAHTR